LTYLEEGFQFWWVESESFGDTFVSLEEGTRGDSSRYPLDRNHVALLGNEGRLRHFLDEVCLDSDGVEEFKDFAGRGIGDGGLALYDVSPFSISGRDFVLGLDQDLSGVTGQVEDLFRLPFNYQLAGSKI